MPVPDRFILWPNDSALEACDDVAAFLFGRIEEALADCDESDSSRLNEVVAYMCCLSAVGHHCSGLTSDYAKAEELRTKVLQVFEWAWSRGQRGEEYSGERTFVCAVLNSLFEVVDKCTVPASRRPWTRC